MVLLVAFLEGDLEVTEDAVTVEDLGGRQIVTAPLDAVLHE